MTPKTRRYLMAGGAIVAVAAIGLWMARPAVVETEFGVVAQGPLRVTLDEDGETRVLHHVAVSAPVTGRLLETSLRAGDSVSRGDVVLTMVAAPLDPRMREQARAAIRAAEAAVSQANAQSDVAKIALDDATRALGRAERMHRTGAIPDRDLESAQQLGQTRQRELDAAREQVVAAEAQRSSAWAALSGASATSVPAGSRVVVRSPSAGRILRVYEEHERMVAAGTPLLELGDPRDLEVVVDVLSSDARLIAVGAPMLVRVSDTATALSARVTRIEPAAFTKLSPLGVQEQRVNVHGAFAEPLAGLGDAYQVRVAIVLWERGDALRVPSSALVAADTGSGWEVFRVRAGRARLVPVRIGHRGTRDAEVLAGLVAGDSVVARPNDKIVEGVRVRAPSRVR
jgi:HlyD family secretion protein